MPAEVPERMPDNTSNNMQYKMLDRLPHREPDINPKEIVRIHARNLRNRLPKFMSHGMSVGGGHASKVDSLLRNGRCHIL